MGTVFQPADQTRPVSFGEPSPLPPIPGFELVCEDGHPSSARLRLGGFEKLPGLLTQHVKFELDARDAVPTLTLTIVPTMFRLLVGKYRLVVRELKDDPHAVREAVIEDPGYVFTKQPITQEEFDKAMNALRRPAASNATEPKSE